MDGRWRSKVLRYKMGTSLTCDDNVPGNDQRNSVLCHLRSWQQHPPGSPLPPKPRPVPATGRGQWLWIPFLLPPHSLFSLSWHLFFPLHIICLPPQGANPQLLCSTSKVFRSSKNMSQRRCGQRYEGAAGWGPLLPWSRDILFKGTIRHFGNWVYTCISHGRAESKEVRDDFGKVLHSFKKSLSTSYVPSSLPGEEMLYSGSSPDSITKASVTEGIQTSELDGPRFGPGAVSHTKLCDL